MKVVTLVMFSAALSALAFLTWVVIFLDHAWLAGIPLIVAMPIVYVIVGILNGRYTDG